MLNKSIAQGATYAVLISALALFSAFRSDKDSPGGTYLHKISSPGGHTLMEYNTDKSVKKIIQVHKTENATYSDVQLPVYENGRLVKTLATDDENAQTGELNATFEYSANTNQVSRISYYRNKAVYTYDSLVYNTAGKVSARYQFSKNPVNGNWENTGYQQYTWDQEGNVTQMDNYGKQPGYSKFIATSSISYTYDRKLNPQQLRPELAYMLDATAANLSAHNVLSESIRTIRSSRVITNTYTYAYNADKYPVRATFKDGMDDGTVKLEWVKLQ